MPTSDAISLHRHVFQLGHVRRALLLLCAMSTPMLAALPAELLDAELQPQPARVVGIANGQVSFFNADRELVRSPLNDWLRLRLLEDPLPADPDAAADAQKKRWDARRQVERRLALMLVQARKRLHADYTWFDPPLTQGVLQLNDTQRWHGQLAGISNDGQQLLWHHPQLGTLAADLLKIQIMHLGDTADTQGPRATGERLEDRIVLVNGDAFTGFVQAFSPQGVQMLPTDAAEPLTLPYDRMRSLHLANPFERPDAAYRLAMPDGTRLLSNRLRLRDGMLGLDMPTALPMELASPITWPAGMFTHCDPLDGHAQLLPLADLSLPAARGDVFGLPAPLHIADDGAVVLTGPLQFTLDLPWPVRRLSATARLATMDPARAPEARWAECTLTIVPAGEEARQFKISGNQPAEAISLATTDPDGVARWTISLDPGRFGPILDRIVLQDAELVIQPRR